MDTTIVARYLTKGGGQVQIGPYVPEDLARHLHCTGCRATWPYEVPYYSESQRAELSFNGARSDAQKHAEKCRAIPD